MNTNKKSTKTKMLKGGTLAAIERDIILKSAQQMSKQLSSQRQKKGNTPSIKRNRGGNQNRLGTFDLRPQKNSRKSPTGASYSDGFDCVSRPEREIVRVEEFDELISTVTGQIAFTISQLAVNPGQSAIFPRLSKFAILYEKYRWEQLEFYFQHDVSQFNAQGAAGLVILSGLYDAASATPTTKAQVEVTEPHVICMPNQNSLLRFNPQRLHPKGYPLYVRPGNVPGGADIKTYDACQAFVTVQGMAGAGEVGELHVRGRIQLIGDILDSSAISAPVNNQVSEFLTATDANEVTATPYTMLLATVGTNGLAAVNASGVITLPAGNYLVSANVRKVFSGSGTVALLALQKNGANAGTSSNETFTAGTRTGLTQFVEVFISSNGTDTIQLVSTDTFSTGTVTLAGTLLILAA